MPSVPPIDRLTREQDTGNQLQFLLNAVSRWWFAIILFIVFGSIPFGLWGMYRYQIPDSYKATAKLSIQSTSLDLTYLQQVQPRKLVELTPQRLEARLRDDTSWATDVVHALIQQDLSKGAPAGAIATPDELELVANRMVGRVRFIVSPQAKSDVLTIQVTGPDAAECRKIADATARVIIERNRQYILESEESIHKYLQDEVDSFRERLDAAEGAAWDFRKDMGFRTHEQVLGDMQRMNQQLLQAEAQKAEIWAKMDEIEADLDEKDDELPLALGRITDSVVSNLNKELESLLQQQLEMSIVYQPEYPELRQIADEISEKQEAILVALQKVDTRAGSSDTWQDHIALRTEYRQLQLELSSLDIKTRTMKRMLNELVEHLPELSDKSRELRQLEGEKEKLAKQFNLLLDRMLEAQIAAQRGANQIERIGSIQVASASQPNQDFRSWFNFVIGAVIGLGVGIAFAMFMEWADSSIRRPEDVTDYIGLDLIGTIPKMQFGSGFRARSQKRRGSYVVQVDEDEVDASIVTKHDPKSPIAEAYRSLRTKFQFATIKQKPRTVMVTSSVPAEGKTTTAVNMAVTMADSGMRVLILDTDLRRPNVHRVLKMERGTGLADVLREGLDVRSVIRPTRVENLWMISSGRVPPNPSELIGSERMRRVVAQLGNSFDIVLCDAPSILVVTDPVLLSSQVDTTLMVVAAEKSTRETILRAKDLLSTAESPVAGVVLNGLATSRRNYYYYYYYYDDRGKSGSRRPV